MTEFYFQSLASGNDEPLRFETQLVENGGVEIGDVVAVFHRMETEFVRGSVGDAALDAAAGEPHRESVGVMIPPIAALITGSPSEFCSPHDQRFIEQAPLFEILEQPGNGKVHLATEPAVSVAQVAMGIPFARPTVTAMENLNEPHPSFH